MEKLQLRPTRGRGEDREGRINRKVPATVIVKENGPG
jgi:hypothetical protein